jgi:hypothetical protein
MKKGMIIPTMFFLALSLVICYGPAFAGDKNVIVTNTPDVFVTNDDSTPVPIVNAQPSIKELYAAPVAGGEHTGYLSLSGYTRVRVWASTGGSGQELLVMGKSPGGAHGYMLDRHVMEPNKPYTTVIECPGIAIDCMNAFGSETMTIIVLAY